MPILHNCSLINLPIFYCDCEWSESLSEKDANLFVHVWLVNATAIEAMLRSQLRQDIIYIDST